MLTDASTSATKPSARAQIGPLSFVASGTPTELKRMAGRNVIEAHVRDREDLPRVAEALGNLDGGEPYVDQATLRVSVSVDADMEQVNAWARSLETVGAAIDDIALRLPTLNEVFLALTGQELEEEPAEPAEKKKR